MIDQMLRAVSLSLPDTLTLPAFTGILASLLLLGFTALVGRLWWRRYQRNRFICRFGVLWDKKHRPFCATCRTLLENWSRHSGWKFERQMGRTVRQPTSYHAFDCSQCRKPVRLLDADGYEVALDQALAQLQEPVEADRAFADGLI